MHRPTHSRPSPRGRECRRHRRRRRNRPPKTRMTAIPARISLRPTGACRRGPGGRCGFIGSPWSFIAASHQWCSPGAHRHPTIGRWRPISRRICCSTATPGRASAVNRRRDRRPDLPRPAFQPEPHLQRALQAEVRRGGQCPDHCVHRSRRPQSARLASGWGRTAASGAARVVGRFAARWRLTTHHG